MVNGRIIDKAVVSFDLEQGAGGDQQSAVANSIKIGRLKDFFEGLEAVVLSLADSHRCSEDDLRMKCRSTSSDKLRYSLYLQVPEKGSYAQPVALIDERANIAPCDEEQAHDVTFGDAFNVVQLFAENNQQGFFEVYKSPSCAKAAKAAIQQMRPQAGELIKVTFPSADKKEGMQFSEESFRYSDDWEDLCLAEPVDGEVIGKLSGVSFDNHTVDIRLKGINKKFTVGYDPEIETRLLENKNELVKVKCKITYNHAGIPAKISDADGIETLVMREVSVGSFKALSEMMYLKNPILATPYLDEETEQIFIVEYPELNLCIYAENQEDIADEIRADLGNLWTRFVLNKDEKLSEDALMVRDNLIKLVRS